MGLKQVMGGKERWKAKKSVKYVVILNYDCL